jgi:cytochrome c553
MSKSFRRTCQWFAALCPFVVAIAAWAQSPNSQVGREVAIPVHLQDGEEFTIPIAHLIQYGAKLFDAKFTVQEGAGRPLSKGTGAPVSDPSSPLVFPRNFDRLSSPEANACSGCHNAPVSGAGGDRVTEVFVLAQRFDHLTFDHNDGITTRGAVDESGKFVTMDNATNDRKTIGMNGSGFVEMLARQMTADLQAERDATPLGNSTHLMSKGISFGILTHNADGTWNTSKVQGLAAPSLSTKSSTPPSLIIRPLHQVGNVISIRQFSTNAFNHHHGMQAEERFGLNSDPDGDGIANELTTADLTAVALFQATLAVPGRVIPNDPAVERANLRGEAMFDKIGCATCHATLPLTSNNNPGLQGQPGWIYFEPNPFNPATGPNAPNLQFWLRLTPISNCTTSAPQVIPQPILSASRSTRISRLDRQASLRGTANLSPASCGVSTIKAEPLCITGSSPLPGRLLKRTTGRRSPRGWHLMPCHRICRTTSLNS